MQIKQLKNRQQRKFTGLLDLLKMRLSCFAAMTARALCPFEDEVKGVISKNRNKIIKGAFYTALSFILGLSRLDMGMLPFGLAILCTGYGENAVFCFAGAALSCLTEGIGGIIQFITFFLIFLLRKNITSSRFDEGLLPRILTAFAGSAFIGACSLFSGGFSFDLLLSYFMYVSLSSLGVFLFSGAVSKEKDDVSNSLRLLSIYSICICLIPALNRLSVFKIDFGVIGAVIMALWICKNKGPVYGCVAGFLFGFACSEPLYSAPIGISCLVSGFLFTKSLFPAVIAFPACSFFVYTYIFGLSEIYSFIPFVLAGALLFLAFQEKMPLLSLDTVLPQKKAPSKRSSKSSEFDRVSESLTGLSAILYKFAEHMKAPSNAETGEIIDCAFSEVCKGCSMKSMCYAKRECNLPSVRSKLVSTLHLRKVDVDELSGLLLDKCIKVKELCDYINTHYSELHFLTMKANRTQTVAGLYNSMSHLMRSTSKHENEKNIRDERLEKCIGDALKRIGVEFSYVAANGSRNKDIIIHGIRADKIPCSSKQLSDYLSDECRIKLSEPVFDISDSADMIMKLSRGEILSVDYAQCCENKQDENVNGDTVCFFESDKGFFYSVIADGMGSGKNAAATSRLSCVFLEKMLSAGTAKNVCIEMLNNLLLSKNDETFSGIDLLEIDKLSGSACFIKAGAAPSFVLRKTRLYKITSETPPVGIIPSFSAESTRFSLEKGDVIIMVSDGVIESDADAVWLSEIISPENQNEPALLAKKLIEKSQELGGRRDDASACVIRIN